MKTWSFRNGKKVMPVDFGKTNPSRFGYEKRPASIFGKATAARKFQGNNISFPGIF